MEQRSAQKLVVIGDVGGHLDVFQEALKVAGADLEAGLLPEDVHVAQVGDLVHKGPQSERCVALAELFLTTNPGRYVQLLGNHEGHYLGGPPAGGPGRVEVNDQARATLKSWWASRKAQMAVAVSTPEGDTLVTHAGLTHGLWAELGRPGTATEAAAAINELMADPRAAFKDGWLLSADIDHAAGPAWAIAGGELYGSWFASDEEAPFNLIHGHDSPWMWSPGQWFDTTPAPVRAATTVLHDSRFTVTSLPGGKTGWGVDWVLGVVAPEGDHWPHIVEGAIIQ